MLQPSVPAALHSPTLVPQERGRCPAGAEEISEIRDIGRRRSSHNAANGTFEALAAVRQPICPPRPDLTMVDPGPMESSRYGWCGRPRRCPLRELVRL